MIRRYPSHEVFLLVQRMNRKTEREQKGHTTSGVIRKQAGDDWF